MALDTFKRNHLMPLHFKGLNNEHKVFTYCHYVRELLSSSIFKNIAYSIS